MEPFKRTDHLLDVHDARIRGLDRTHRTSRFYAERERRDAATPARAYALALLDGEDECASGAAQRLAINAEHREALI